MPDPVAAASRAAAERLASEFGTGLALGVEEALPGQGEARPPERYFDPLSLGSLIVSVATLAWTVFKDMRNKGVEPQAKTLANRVRVELETDDRVTPADRERIIQVVISEIILASKPSAGFHGNVAE